MQETRTCTGCREAKPLDAFYRHPTAAGGRQRRCAECRKRAMHEYRHSEQGRESHRRWAQSERGRAVLRRKAIKKRFGLTPDEYDALIARGCAICGTADDVCLDHDHETGLVRAALCGRCNRGIGQFKDDPDRLRNAAEYLERYATR